MFNKFLIAYKEIFKIVKNQINWKILSVIESKLMESKLMESKLIESKLMESKLMESKLMESKLMDTFSEFVF